MGQFVHPEGTICRFRLEKTTDHCHMDANGRFDPLLHGSRAACTKLAYTNFAPLFRSPNRPTTLATRDVSKPRDSAARNRGTAASLYKKESF